MPLKRLRPTSPGVRGAVRPDFTELTRRSPHKPLTKGKHHTGGRNVRGKMTVRHRGGGAKQSWREIDFKRDKYGIPCRVESIEYDPNRSGRIALVLYADGARRYMLAPQGLRLRDSLMSGPTAPIRSGNALPLRNIPTGTQVHNIELQPGMGGQMCRAPGPGPNSSPGTTATRCSGSRRDRSGGCPARAWPRLARWATLSTRTPSWAKRDATAIWASGPRRAARP